METPSMVRCGVGPAWLGCHTCHAAAGLCAAARRPCIQHAVTRGGCAARGGLTLSPAAPPPCPACLPTSDPYRWLEDPDSAETQAFVARQNELTAGVLAQCESRAAFKELFTQVRLGLWATQRQALLPAVVQL